MANAIWTRWNRLQSLNIVRTSLSVLGAPGSTLSVLPFDWRDTYYFAVGLSYKFDETLKLQAGIGHDSGASPDATRTPRLPDQSRIQCSVGARYRVTRSGTVDLAYSHDFIRDASIDTGVVGAPGSLIGTFKNSANTLSAQYSYQF
jgi:long-chain fatty acid transport protein